MKKNNSAKMIRRPSVWRVLRTVLFGSILMDRRKSAPSINHPSMLSTLKRHPTSWGRE